MKNGTSKHYPFSRQLPLVAFNTILYKDDMRTLFVHTLRKCTKIHVSHTAGHLPFLSTDTWSIKWGSLTNDNYRKLQTRHSVFQISFESRKSW